MPTIKDGDWVLKDIQEVEDEAMKVIRIAQSIISFLQVPVQVKLNYWLKKHVF
jgi:hypothetical protein